MSAAVEIPLIKKDIQIMNSSIQEIKNDLCKHFDDEAGRHREFQEFKEELFDKLETRFAGKWTEKVIIFIWTTIWVVLIWALLSLVIKN